MKNNAQLNIKILCILACLIHIHSTGATDSSRVKFQFYADSYMGIEPLNRNQSTRPPFLYSHHRNETFSINLAFIALEQEKGRIRYKAALMDGTYARTNLAAEPGLLKHLYEGRIGYRLTGKGNWWLDAGVFSSHIGAESAESNTCPTLSRSIMADNSPYFESGLRLVNNSGRSRVNGGLYLLNGWQRIKPLAGNTMPSFGHQVIWKVRNNLKLNSSSFAGSDSPDSARCFRLFHNLYAEWTLRNNFHLFASLDLGRQQAAKGSNIWNSWTTSALIIQWKYIEKLAIAGRIEHFSDPHAVLTNMVQNNPLQTMGYSLNTDFIPKPGLLFRLESRLFQNATPYFLEMGRPVRHYFNLTASIIYNLEL